MISRKKYDKSVDIWAVGILIYELCTGSPPFESDSTEETYKRIMKRGLKLPTYLSIDCKDLINKMIQLEPSNRLPLS
jgi:aurora kinase